MRYDGLNIRTEYARICALECWHPKIRSNRPQLDIVRVTKGNVRTLGTARVWANHIRLRIQVGKHTRFDIMETLVHEVAHHDAQLRENDRATAENRQRRHIKHEAEFWLSNDRGFEAAYPEAFQYVGPRVNKYHGRYAKALRRAAGLSEYEAKKEVTTAYVRNPLPGPAWVKKPAASIAPIEPDLPRPTPPGGRLTGTALTDDKVRLLVKAWPGCTREQIQGLYEKTYGKYPGASVYNSLWRLRRDGKVRRVGHSWHVC